MGRTTQNTVVVFPRENYQAGEFVEVKIEECTSATLLGQAIGYSANQELAGDGVLAEKPEKNS